MHYRQRAYSPLEVEDVEGARAALARTGAVAAIVLAALSQGEYASSPDEVG